MKDIKLGFWRIAGLVVLVSLLAVVQASELRQKGVFSISLPEQWVEMPRDVIDAYEKETARMAPNAPVQHYDYGFQLGSAERWFEYPYVLVQVNNMGRIPENQFEKLEEYSVQEDLEKQKEALSPVISDTQAGKMHFDKAARIVWLRIESNVVGIGPVSGLSGTIPTEEGFIQVSGYSLRNDFPAYESVFRAAAMSVTPSNELVYTPRWSDSLPPAIGRIDWSQVAGMAIMGMIIGGIVTWFTGFRRKKKQ